ncbi:hypothetical protein EST38_g4926 [Candolleomyces aberdarensis]|uniref:Protein kinase domain-containing protein n=1 Tax=Candolleomyces aberdarensis TaxID=2316362 RepID=A0A4Q2DPQ8_9AGAR|nr:hypothetical protein EST38_g4926 [Candolleomyces aberdarensis]
MFNASQDASTPHRKHSQTGAATTALSTRKTALHEELSSQTDIPTCSAEHVRSLYLNEVTDDEITKFLNETSFYNNGRWTLPPSEDLKEVDLYAPYVNIANDIVTRIRGPRANSRRIAVDSHATQLAHEEEEQTTAYSSPDIVIKATGSSFQIPQTVKRKAGDLGFSNIASCFDGKVDGNVGEKDVQQLGIYSRQIFIHQPNRKFVRALILTEKRFRLFHFDRSGAECSPYFNVHDEAHLFVRLIMGLSSHDEAVLGFDTTIQWKHEDGRKYHGTITVEHDGEVKVYTLNDPEPIFKRYTIRGRATTCWEATDEFDNRVVIKDSWRSHDRTPEHEFLSEAKRLAQERGIELQGVVNMLAYQENLAQTTQFRAQPQGGLDAHHRIQSRIVMPAYGSPIHGFRTRLEVLYAFRDVIAGLRNLVCVELIHRDVSINNILLNEGGKKGNRGILIDLDMAMRAGRSKMSADFRTGTRMYQSVAVLWSCTVDEGDAPPHNHLDDLESCFYVFVHLVFLYVAPGIESTTPLPIDKWDNVDPEIVYPFKESFVNGAIKSSLVSPFWGKEILALIKNLQLFFRQILREKAEWDDAFHDPERHKALVKILLENIEQHYDHVLNLFDTTIAEIEKIDLAAGSANTLPTATPASANGSTSVRRSSRLGSGDRGSNAVTESRGQKRVSRDEDDDGPLDERPPKRATPVASLADADGN